MTTAQVVETSVTVNNNSPIQDYVHPDDQTQPTFANVLASEQLRITYTFTQFYTSEILSNNLDKRNKRKYLWCNDWTQFWKELYGWVPALLCFKLIRAHH